MSFFIYFLRTQSNRLYIGHTNNLERREIEHKGYHHAAKFIKDNDGTFKMVYTEEYSTRTEAMRREKQLKRWTRAKKEALICGNFELLKKL